MVLEKRVPDAGEDAARDEPPSNLDSVHALPFEAKRQRLESPVHKPGLEGPKDAPPVSLP